MRHFSLSLFVGLVSLCGLWFVAPSFEPYKVRAVAPSDVKMAQVSGADWPTPVPSTSKPNQGRNRQASFSLTIKDGMFMVVPRAKAETTLWVNGIPLGGDVPVDKAGPALGPVQHAAQVGPIFLGFSPNRFDVMAETAFDWAGVGPIWFTDLTRGAAFQAALLQHQIWLGRVGWLVSLIGLGFCALGLFFRANRWSFVAGACVAGALLAQGTGAISNDALWLIAMLSAGACWLLLHKSRPIVAGLAACAALACVGGLSLLLWAPPPWIYLKIASISVQGMWPLLAVGLPFLTLTNLRGLANEFVSARAKIADQEVIIQSQEADLHAAIRSSAINEERQRFVRDMHDGVGGQLLSLLMQVRSKSIKTDEIESELQRGLHDLRLMADSLDHVGDDLELALSAFERRATQQLVSAGISLSWSKGDNLNSLAWDGRKILNLYRVLQEALTNCIRHSGATSISFSFVLTQAGTGLDVTIIDNGKGLDSNAVNGRGLANITKRAAALGSSVTFKPGIDNKGLALLIRSKSTS